MPSIRRWLLLAFMLPLLAMAQGATVRTEEVTAELVVHAPDGVVPGRPVWLGLVIQHAPHWHTYWSNPGDSGLATTFDWQLPAGFVAGAVEWPTPQRLPIGPLVNYGYEGTVLLAVPVVVPVDFHAASLDVKLRADWLVCREQCIPQSGEFSLAVPSSAASVAHADLFARARATLPRELASAGAVARIEAQNLVLEVDGLPEDLTGKPVTFFAGDAGVIDHAAVIDQRWKGDTLSLRVPLSPQRSESPPMMQAVIAGPTSEAGVAIRFAVRDWPATVGTSMAPAVAIVEPPVVTQDNASILLTLTLAFTGGLFLNLMPCVFPVLSLKVLGFARHAEDRRLLAAGGVAYTLGVVLSFVALAGLLLGLRAAGEQLGWGFQLQSPAFVAALALLFALIGLNLAGVFEFGNLLPHRLAALQARHPVIDHGLTGVLAVAVASPCTAPFMGAALGVALTQPLSQALTIFAMLGLGMAAPYLLASLWPGLVGLLPRPGSWMAHFRAAMAFPMFATVVWLAWVLGHQAGVDAVAALLGMLVAVAFLAWVYGSGPRGNLGRPALLTAAIALVLASGAWTWRSLSEDPAAVVSAQSQLAKSPSDMRWQRWSPDAVEQALAAGRPVFVDFTAAWCVTCQFNKRTTLNDAELLKELDANGVQLLRADWTRRDPEITVELERLARTGVPVYALYAPGARAPQLLSELLTVGEVRRAMAAWPAAGVNGRRATIDRPLSLTTTRSIP